MIHTDRARWDEMSTSKSEGPSTLQPTSHPATPSRSRRDSERASSEPNERQPHRDRCSIRQRWQLRKCSPWRSCQAHLLPAHGNKVGPIKRQWRAPALPLLTGLTWTASFEYFLPRSWATSQRLFARFLREYLGYWWAGPWNAFSSIHRCTHQIVLGYFNPGVQRLGTLISIEVVPEGDGKERTWTGCEQ